MTLLKDQSGAYFFLIQRLDTSDATQAHHVKLRPIIDGAKRRNSGNFLLSLEARSFQFNNQENTVTKEMGIQ